MLEYRRRGGEGGEGEGEQERKEEEKRLLDTFYQGTTNSPESFSLRTT